MSAEEREEIVAQFMSATGWSCEYGQALLAAHDWQLQAALAEVLGADVSAHASLEKAARRSREDLDRDLATALASSTGNKEDALHEQRQLMLLQEQQRRAGQAEWASAKVPVPATASNAAAPPKPTAQQTSLPGDVQEFLEAAGLAAFAGSFAANGYDEMPIIRMMGNAEMDEVGLKGGHKLKLREALKGSGAGCSASALAPVAAAAAAAPPAAVAAPAAPQRATAAAPPAAPAAVQRTTAPTPEPRRETGPSLGPWPDELEATPAPPDATAGREEPQGSRPASAAAGSGGGGSGASGALAGLLRGPGGAKPAQRRFIKDGKITYVDE